MGIILGASGFAPKKVLKYNDSITMIGVLVLLFMMGLSLGLKVDIQAFRTLGLQSLVFTGLTIFFSLLVVYLLTKWVLKEKKS
jgi:Kef-type K+ transport system membrane component KefB